MFGLSTHDMLLVGGSVATFVATAWLATTQWGYEFNAMVESWLERKLGERGYRLFGIAFFILCVTLAFGFWISDMRRILGY